MLKPVNGTPGDVTDYSYTRMEYDLSAGRQVRFEDLRVEDDMDFLGGIGRSFKILSGHDVSDPFAPTPRWSSIRAVSPARSS